MRSLWFLFLVCGCFHEVDPGDHANATEETVTSSTGAATDAFTGTMDVTETHGTSDPHTAASDTHTETVTQGSSSTDSSCETNDCTECSPVDVPIEDPFGVGEARTLYMDFDDFPGLPGEQAEICATFTTDNSNSARMITIGVSETVDLGPCGGAGPPPGPFVNCQSYIKPSGVTQVVVDNSSQTGGCQSGAMDELVLSFNCP